LQSLKRLVTEGSYTFNTCIWHFDKSFLMFVCIELGATTSVVWLMTVEVVDFIGEVDFLFYFYTLGFFLLPQHIYRLFNLSILIINMLEIKTKIGFTFMV
jgi:hypothetical protein